MKRNSKRFLALFLSVAMTVTPAVLTQAENEDANVQVSVTTNSRNRGGRLLLRC